MRRPEERTKTKRVESSHFKLAVEVSERAQKWEGMREGCMESRNIHDYISTFFWEALISH